jgi:hypothetical protein
MGNLVAAAMLFVVVTAAFGPFAYGDRSLMSSAAEAPSIYLAGGRPDGSVRGYNKLIDPGAAAWQTEPEFWLEHNEIVDDRVAPLWNPYSAFGTPLAANMISQPYFPLTWLVIAHPTARAYNWFIILRFYFGALFMFLFLRNFVGFAGALAGAIGFAFTGYFVLYYNIAHLSVECFTPAVLWAMEFLIRRPSRARIVVLACTIALLIFGGMPESALLAFAFAYLYFVVRILSDSGDRMRWRGLAARLAAATVLGAGFAAVVELPFLEFLGLSVNQHVAGDVGLLGEEFSFAALGSYVAPLIYGPPYNNVFTGFNGWNGIVGWCGISELFFSLIAVFGLAGNIRRQLERYAGVPLFFVVVAGVLFLKRFTNPLVNWIGALPGFRFIIFPKYEEAVIGFCLAALTAYGINEIARGKVKPLTAWLAALVPLAFLTAIAAVQRPAFLHVTLGRQWYLLALAGALLLLVVASVLTWASLTPRGARRAGALAALAAAVVVFEALGSYIVPLWYVANQEAPLDRAPIHGAPYIDAIRSLTAADHARFYGEDYLLFPEWSAAYGISDVRDLNALYNFRYLAFLRAFLTPGADGELHDRFTGREPIDFTAPSEQRFLTLSSIGYVGTQRPLPLGDSLLERASLSHLAATLPKLQQKSYSIAGVKRDAVLMPAPQQRYPVTIGIPRTARSLQFAIAMDPAIWSVPGQICGDGVSFAVDIQEANGTISNIFRRYIDPKHDVGERKWLDVSAPVARWAGSTVQVLFSTSPGPSGNTCDDFALWSNVRFDVSFGAPPLAVAYQSGDTRIYRFANALPRLALYRNVVRVKTDADALALLADPKFDPFESAVVIGPNASLPGVGVRLPGTRAVAGRIVHYGPQQVVASIDAPGASLAVLNDTDYPGWVASVDGREAPIVTADYMFRGVVVPAGRHVLEFDYRPASFSIGLLVTVISVLAAIALMVIPRVRLRRAQAVAVE